MKVSNYVAPYGSYGYFPHSKNVQQKGKDISFGEYEKKQKNQIDGYLKDKGFGFFDRRVFKNSYLVFSLDKGVLKCNLPQRDALVIMVHDNYRKIDRIKERLESTNHEVEDVKTLKELDSEYKKVLRECYDKELNRRFGEDEEDTW